MRRLCVWFSSLALIAAPAFAPADVAGTIDTVLRDPYFKTVRVGIKIAKLGAAAPATTVYEKDATRPLAPASNLKLITTAAALNTLGPGFVFRTTLVRKESTLALIGDGDPSLGDAEALAKTGWTSTTLFDKWAEVLRARGVTTAANLVYDDTIFDDRYVHPNWPPDQIHKRYVAGVGGLNLNANCLDFYLRPKGVGEVVDYTVDPSTSYAPIANTCVGGRRNAVWLSRASDSNRIELRGQTDGPNTAPISVTVDSPPLFTAMVLRDALKRGGVAVAGEVTRDPTVRGAGGWQTLAVYETPIAQVVARANKDSMNVYAEALCKRVGAKAAGTAGDWSNGTAAVGGFLQSIGVKADQFALDDGCGLSRKNAISPAAIVSVLEHEFYAGHRDAYLSSLSVAGVDGTLKERFAGSTLRERVIGKSGFISGVSALSGFLKAKDGSTYVFAILFNGIADGTNSRAKALQEQIVQALD